MVPPIPPEPTTATLTVLLLMPDRPRRQRLEQACHASGRPVCVLSPADETTVPYLVTPDRLDLVVVDAALAADRGPAWLANLRRLAPRGRLLILDGHSGRELDHLQQALQHRPDAGGGAGNP